MKKSALGWLLLIIGLIGITAALVHDFISGQPALTLGPKSYTVLVVSIILALVGVVSLAKGGGQAS
jgi:hypothetical protein